MSTEAVTVEQGTPTLTPDQTAFVQKQASHLEDLGYRPPPLTQEQQAQQVVREGTQTEAPPADKGQQQQAAPAADAAAAAEQRRKFSSFTAPPPAPKAFTPEALEVFKSRGIEDPEKFFGEHSEMREQIGLLSKKAEASEQVAQQLAKLDPIHQEMVRRMFKGENVLEWARSQPKVDLTKDFGRQNKVDMLREFAPDIFTAQQLDMLANPDNYTKEEVEAIQRLAGPALEIAKVKFNSLHETELNRGKQEAQKQQDFLQGYEKSIARNIAKVRDTDPDLALGIDQAYINDFASGKKLNDRFFESDGVTWKESAMHDLRTLESLPEILQSVKEAAYAEGEQAERARSMQRHPSTLPMANGARVLQTGTPEEKKQQDHLNDLK